LDDVADLKKQWDQAESTLQEKISVRHSLEQAMEQRERFHEQVTTLSVQLDKLTAEVPVLRDQRDQLLSEKQDLLDNKRELQEQKQRLQDESVAATERQKELAAEMRELEKHVEVDRETDHELQRNIRTVRVEVEALAEQLKESVNEVDQLKNELLALELKKANEAPARDFVADYRLPPQFFLPKRGLLEAQPGDGSSAAEADDSKSSISDFFSKSPISGGG